MVEISEHVEAEEDPLLSVFSGDSTYRIPSFQRPFSWSEENFEELVDDIVTAFEDEVPDHTRNEGAPRDESGEYPFSIEDMEPYFLGSLILKTTHDGAARYEVIDGQQRLTSLSILIAVLRDLMQDEWDGIVGDGWVSSLHEYIYVPGSLTGGTQEMIRLHVRERETGFYKANVLEKGATMNPPGKKENGLTDPQERMLTAIDVFKTYLIEWVNDGGDPTLLVPYLTLRIGMVKIETYSLQSAFRLFNVTNARGTPLTNADLLKSENLRAVPEDQREKYSNTWERIESDLDNDGLEELIGLMRHIKLKNKNKSTIHKEFKQKVFEKEPSFQGVNFIEELEELYETYCGRILDGDLSSSDERHDIHYHNLVSLLRNVYPSDEWMLPIISFDMEFNDHDVLYELTVNLERTLTIGWYTSASTTDRYTLVYDLLEQIETATTPEDVLKTEALGRPDESDAENLRRALDATNFYRKGNYAWPKYLLLRLELARHPNETVKREYGNGISIEHILPQTPDTDYWISRFDDEEFLNTWTDRLGNLVPLEARKNYKASNKPFRDKYVKYFKERSGDLDLITDLEEYDDWTTDTLERRHEELKAEAIDVWFDDQKKLIQKSFAN